MKAIIIAQLWKCVVKQDSKINGFLSVTLIALLLVSDNNQFVLFTVVCKVNKISILKICVIDRLGIFFLYAFLPVDVCVVTCQDCHRQKCWRRRRSGSWCPDWTPACPAPSTTTTGRDPSVSSLQIDRSLLDFIPTEYNGRPLMLN